MKTTSRTLLTALCALATAFTATAQVKKPIVKLPFTITKPGNYYLATDLAITKAGQGGSTDGITILTGNVSLDLNGREITSTLGTGAGIRAAQADLANVRITNGTIRGFASGLNLSGDRRFDVADLTILDSTQTGIYVDVSFSTYRRCHILGVGSPTAAGSVDGISCSSVVGIVIEDCEFEGFQGAANATFTGIFCANGECRFSRNTFAGPGSNVTKSIAINSKNGSARVTENYAVSWATGFDLGPGVYRNNDALACAVGYKGGIDGGGNK